MVARLHVRIPVIDAEGDKVTDATVKFYQPGTASVSGTTTTGTPFAGNLYAAVSGGSPVSTTQTTDPNGEVVIFTDTKSRFDVGIEIGGSVPIARVASYETFELDPADVVTLDAGGQATFADGTLSNPSIANTGDLNTGLNFTSTADKLQLVVGGIEALAADPADAAALLTVTRTDDVAAGVLALVHGATGNGVATDLGTLEILKYQTAPNDLNAALRVTNQVIDGAGGSNVGAQITVNLESGWTVSGGNGIGLIASGETFKAGSNIYGGEFFGVAGGNSAAGAVTGIEVNPIVRTGSTAVNRYGVQVVSPDASTVQATNDDVAYRVARKALGAAFKHAFRVDTGGGAWPLDGTVGVILGTDGAGTANYGIDFADTTFVTSPITVPGLAIQMVSSSPKTVISDAWASTTPQARLHVKDTTTTEALIAQANNASRFNGQLQIRGNTDTNLRLNVGVETTNEFGIVQAIKNGVGALPLALQPDGGVTTFGDFTDAVVTPDTTVLAHLVGGGLSHVALAFDDIKTTTTAPSAGGAGALPATPLGYIHAKVEGTEVKWPYYGA